MSTPREPLEGSPIAEPLEGKMVPVDGASPAGEARVAASGAGVRRTRPGVLAQIRAYAGTFTAFTPNARRLLAGTTCLWVGIGIFGVLFNLYLIALGYNVAFIGLLSALSTVGQASVSPILGPLLRHWPARKVMTIAMALTALTMVGSSIFTPAPLLILATLIQGAAVAGATIPSSPFIMEQSTVARRAHLFSAYMSSNNLGSMAGSLLSGVIPALAVLVPIWRRQVVAVDRLGLLVGAAFTAVGVLALWRITEERVEPENADDGPVAAAGGLIDEDQLRRDMLAMMAAAVFIALSLGIIYPLLNVYFATVHHASAATIGIIYAVSGVFCTFGALLAPAAARQGTLTGLVAFRIVSAPLLLIFWLQPGLIVVAIAYIARNILGQITGALENTFAMEVVPANVRAAVATWRTFAFNVGWTLGSLVAGLVVARYGFDPIFVAGTVLTLVGSLTWYRHFGGRRWLVRFPLHSVRRRAS